MEEDDQNFKEPYRATRLWNEVILAFRTGMPLKRHRYHMQHYDDCFLSSDCISWLNCYLKVNPNFGPHVTRQQTVQLLQKFLKCKVIESATGKSKKSEFKDNSHLYRFGQYSPRKPTRKSPMHSLLRMPLQSRENYDVNGSFRVSEKKKTSGNADGTHREITRNIISILPECHFIERQLTVQEMEFVYKSVVVNKVRQAVVVSLQSGQGDILASVTGRTIMHNMTKVSRTGVVLLLDKTDDIPHWVMSAMKCLANWPDASGTGSCLPKYPGFEKDVFKVVKDYFLNPGLPLMPPDIQLLLIQIFCTLMHQNCDDCFKRAEREAFEANCHDDYVKTSTPLEPSKSLLAEANSSASVTPHIQSAAGKLLLDDSTAIWENPLSMYFETEFTETAPITRVVPDFTESTSMRSSYLSLSTENKHDSMAADTMSTMSACSSNTRKYQTSMIYYDAADDLNCASTFSEKGKTYLHHSSDELDSSSSNLSEKNKSSVYGKVNDLTVNMNPNVENTESPMMYPAIATLPRKGTSRNRIFRNASHGSLAFEQGLYNGRSMPIRNAASSLSLCLLPKERVYSLYEPLPSKCAAIVESSCYKGVPSPGGMTPLHSNSQKESFKEVLSILVLCLPISNRRQIHLLLRMLNKISRNKELLSDSPLLTKEFLLQTFVPAIFNLNNVTNGGLASCSQIFSMLVEECESIFKPPPDLIEKVHSQLRELKCRRINYTMDDLSAITYCEMISRQQYEQQKVSASQQALADLLERIITENGSEKDKRKKLKQFKTMHPEVYHRRFPNSTDEINLFVKPRKQLLHRFFGLRL